MDRIDAEIKRATDGIARRRATKIEASIKVYLAAGFSRSDLEIVHPRGGGEPYVRVKREA